jgi:hypothetical protein
VLSFLNIRSKVRRWVALWRMRLTKQVFNSAH